MKRIILIVILAVLSESCRVIEERANGVTAQRETNSGFVLIESFNGFTQKYLCSGILISPKFVLTSASCVFGTTFVNVHVYAYKLRDQYETSREIHRIDGGSALHFNQYNGLQHLNDIALIEMPSSFYVTGKSYLQFAQLPTTSMTNGIIGSTIGWGLLNFDDDNAATYKQELSMTVLAEQECIDAYPNLDWSNGAQGRACIKRSSSGTNCVSDVGSPFLVNGIVHGLQSHGQIEACDSEQPNLIQDVFYHAEWINSIIASVQ